MRGITRIEQLDDKRRGMLYPAARFYSGQPDTGFCTVLYFTDDGGVVVLRDGHKMPERFPLAAFEVLPAEEHCPDAGNESDLERARR